MVTVDENLTIRIELQPRKWIYRLPGETASQKNSQTFNTRTRTMAKSAAFRKWQADALKRVREQGTPGIPLHSAKISIRLVHADLRRRDGDNQLSSIQDLLVKAGVIEDDSWTRIGSPSVSHARGEAARCEIAVEEVPADFWIKESGR